MSRIPSSVRERMPPGVLSAAKRGFYAGHRYTCPFCTSRLRTFRPRGLDHGVLEELQVIGGGWRPQAVCPVCGSVDRERLVLLYLQQRTDVFARPVRLLHVAPEPSLGALLQGCEFIDYLSADLNSPDVMVKMDITNIDFPADTFDFVICNHVLEHVPDDRRAIREFRRVLKPGGRAILQVPISHRIDATREDPSVTGPSQRERVFGQEDHVRIYAPDYPDRIRECNLELDEFDWTRSPEGFGGVRNQFGLLERELVFCATKPR